MRRSALGALAGAAFVAGSAAAVMVAQSSYSALTAELLDVGSSLAVLPGGIAVNALGLPAAGDTSGTALELALLPGTATPGVTAGHYAYTVRLDEASAGAITTGTYAVTLNVDGAPKGTAYFKQDTSDLLNIEAVSVVWDVGTSPPTGATVFEVTVA